MIDALPDYSYHDPALFARETERILRRAWWLVGIEASLGDAGQYAALDLLRWPVVVVRDHDGELRAFYNICRHRAGPLVYPGEGRCRDFVCRYHAWRYALDGELLRTPGLEPGEVGDLIELGLVPLRVDCWNGLVFVCLDDATPALIDWLGEIPAIAERFDPVVALEFDGETQKEAAANWKAYADNSCEGYHVGMVHRTLGSSLERETVSLETHEHGRFVGFDVAYTAGADTSRAGKGYWIYKYPGLLLHFADYAFNAETVMPLGPAKIRLRRWFFSHPDKTRAHGIDRATIQPNSERVMDEDVAICEAVQRNLESGAYPGGRLSPRQEPGTVFFQGLVRADLGDALEAPADDE